MSEPTERDAKKILNSHGHAFQYAVIRRAEELSSRSRWIFEAAEFPVGDLQNTIHIDFILRGRGGGDRNRIYLVAECKRADPARANWCFVKAPYTRRNPYFSSELVFQAVHHRPANLVSSGPLRKAGSGDRLSHLGFEMRTSASGDGTSGGGSGISIATTQVLRGVNGLVDHLFAQVGTIENEGTALFLPVIFTTARLWIADGDLGEAELATGRLPDDWGSLRSVPWLWFNYNQSPALRHHLLSGPSGFDLSEAVYAEYTRSVAIVGPEGIEAFLQADLDSWLQDN